MVKCDKQCWRLNASSQGFNERFANDGLKLAAQREAFLSALWSVGALEDEASLQLMPSIGVNKLNAPLSVFSGAFGGVFHAFAGMLPSR